MNRSARESFSPAGKGVNVSRVLKLLGVESVAICLCGTGFAGEEFARTLDVESVLIRVAGRDTRINVKISENGVVTEFNGGFSVDEKALSALGDALKTPAKSDTLVIGGSVPDGVPDTFCEDTARALSERGARVIADVSGRSLTGAVKGGSFLVKPNADELGELFGVKINGFGDAAFYGKKLAERGSGGVLVSLGGDGAVLVAPDGVHTARAPEGDAVYTVGAGDALLAGFIAEFSRSSDYGKSLAFGVETGSRAAFGGLL
jgi:1-phosphofructokinase